MENMYAKRKRNNITNRATLDEVVAATTIKKDGGQICKADGVFLGNDERTKRARLDRAYTAVEQLGWTSDVPLTANAVREAYINACRGVNAASQSDKVIMGLDLALRVVEDLNAQVEREDIDFENATMNEVPVGYDPIDEAEQAIKNAMAMIIARRMDFAGPPEK